MSRYLSMLMLMIFSSVSLFFIPLSFADAGPSSPPPSVKVELQGVGAETIDSIYFHCMGSDTEDPNGPGQRIVRMDCAEGICTNTDWFYKLNPCYKFPSGDFTYTLEGTERRTGAVVNDQPDMSAYKVVIDVQKAKVVGFESKDFITACLLPYSILLSLGISALIRR